MDLFCRETHAQSLAVAAGGGGPNNNAAAAAVAADVFGRYDFMLGSTWILPLGGSWGSVGSTTSLKLVANVDLYHLPRPDSSSWGLCSVGSTHQLHS